MADIKNWTIMVYMAGDNNLSTDMVYALEQMKMVADGNHGNQGINLFVYFDGLSSDVPTLYCDFSKSGEPTSSSHEFYPSYKIIDKLIDVKDEFNENSAAVNNIINFVDWCVKKDQENHSTEELKEKKYAFIFSGHTFGFVNKGLFKDAKSDYYMTHAKLKYMFERITSTKEELNRKAAVDEEEFNSRYAKKWDDKRRKERTTPILGKPLDLLGFDTCVMSTLEIGCQFRKFAKTMVASEGSIPTAGWNYAEILLKNIKGKSKTDSQMLALSFVDEFIKQQNKFALADISVDISAWNLGKMRPLEKSFEELADNLLKCFKNKKTPVYHQMRRLITYAHWQCQTYLLEQHIDLGDFCQLLTKEIDLLEKEISATDLSPIFKVRETCQKVIESIRNCIMLTGFSGSDFQFSTGISLFFPWSWVCYLSAADDYNKLTFIKENPAGKKWNKFLIKYLNDITMRVATPLTKTDGINSKTNSVIYESYTNVFENPDTNGFDGSSASSEHKSGKQFPNSSRQFPNSARLTDEISIFISRFMKLKNYESNWNRTGFTSNTVSFQAETTNDFTGVNARLDPTSPPVIKIPIARTLQDKIIDKLFVRLEEIKQDFAESIAIEELQKKIPAVLKTSDETKATKIFKRLSELNFLKSRNITQEDLKTDLDKASSILDSTK
jgi:Clostripain family